MEALIDILKKETETLKKQYMETTEKWAIEDFNRLRKWAIDYQKGLFGYGEASKKYWKLPYYIVNSNGTVNIHIEKMLKEASNHYENSILKLADRIEKKGLNQNKITVVTSYIGVNIEITLTDGDKTVKAFTIIAEGEIQKPHYRYLIK